MFTPTEQEKHIIKNVIIAVLLLLLTLFGIDTWYTLNKNHNLENKLVTAIYNDSMGVEQVKTKEGLITTQKQLIANKDQEIVKHIEKENHLSSLIGQISYKTTFRIDTVLIPYKDSTHLLVIKDTISGKIDSFDCLPLPSRVEKIDSDYQIDETIIPNGVLINHLIIPNTTTITIGDAKKGLFKTESIVKIKNSNRHISQENTKNIFTDQKSKTKPIKTFLIGLGSGIAATIAAIVILKH